MIGSFIIVPDPGEVKIVSNVSGGDAWGIYSNYFSINRTKYEPFNWLYLIYQTALICFLYEYLELKSLICIDGVVSGTVFLRDYYGLRFDGFFQKSYPQRLLYYLILNAVLKVIFWDSVPVFVEKPLTIIALLPYVMDRVIGSPEFQFQYDRLIEALERLGYRLVSKRMCKIVEKISSTHLDSDLKLDPEEFVGTISELSWKQIGDFVSSAGMAGLLQYLESDGRKFYTVLLRQYYFREFMFGNESRSELSSKDYVADIIRRRRWSKFSDAYALNHVLQVYVELSNDDGENYLEAKFRELSVSTALCFGRIMTIWSFAEAFRFRAGYIWNLLFLEDIYHFAYVLTALFVIYENTEHKILNLFLLEFVYRIVRTDHFRELRKELFSKRRFDVVNVVITNLVIASGFSSMLFYLVFICLVNLFMRHRFLEKSLATVMACYSLGYVFSENNLYHVATLSLIFDKLQN